MGFLEAFIESVPTPFQAYMTTLFFGGIVLGILHLIGN